MRVMLLDVPAIPRSDGSAACRNEGVQFLHDHDPRGQARDIRRVSVRWPVSQCGHRRGGGSEVSGGSAASASAGEQGRETPACRADPRGVRFRADLAVGKPHNARLLLRSIGVWGKPEQQRPGRRLCRRLDRSADKFLWTASHLRKLARDEGRSARRYRGPTRPQRHPWSRSITVISRRATWPRPFATRLAALALLSHQPWYPSVRYEGRRRRQVFAAPIGVRSPCGQ